MAYELHMGDDGILRVRHIGDFSKEEVEAYLKEVMPFLEAAQPKPLCVLVDHRQAGKIRSAARKALREVARKNKGGKVALLGASPYIRVLVSFMQKATGGESIRICDSEEEALVWLREGEV